MIAVPAIDLRGGRCVQLVGGEPDSERVSMSDPMGVAKLWWQAGFRCLHVVDLDAALGDGDNRELVAALCREWPGTVQVGGGLRSLASVAAVVGAGADRVMLGTRAVEDPDWLKAVAETYPGRVLAAADVRDGVILTSGWTRATRLGVREYVQSLAALPLAGVLCTDVAREGRVAGIDMRKAEKVVRASPHPVWMAGGIHRLDELRQLERMGVQGAVLGMALYTSALNPRAVAAEFRAPASLHSQAAGTT